MTVMEKENIERVEKIDKSTQSKMNMNQLCAFMRQRFECCLKNFKLTDIADKITNTYLCHPGLFILSLIVIASVLVPIIVVISIIAIHVTIGILVFIIFEAIILLSSAAVLSFLFLLIVATLVMAGVSILAIYVGAQWLTSKLKNFKKNFFYDILQY